MESTIFAKVQNDLRALRKKKHFPLVVVIVVFALSRILFYWAGMRYYADTYYLGWQFIDPYLLKNDLWRSVFYLHSQPPLLNLITGLGLQIFPENYGVFFQVEFILLGLVLGLSIYLLGIELGFSTWLSADVSIWFLVSPATVTYENWYFYTYPLTVCLSLAGVFFSRFIRKGLPGDGILFSLFLALMALTWGLFHLLWLVFCLGLAVVLLTKERKLAVWLLPGLLLATMWYAKNEVMYDTFSASSWGGMNLSKIVTQGIPEQTRKSWAKQGLVSELAALPPFRSPGKYLQYFPETPKTGIPLLDQEEYSTGFPNYHSLAHISASQQHLRDSIQIILLAPRHFALNLLRSTYIFFHAASDYEHVFAIRQPIDGLDTFWNRLFYGQLQKDEKFYEMGSSFSLDHVGWFLVMGYVFSMGSGVFYIWKQRAALLESKTGLVLFLMWNILFVSVMGIAFDIGENNRFRFVIDPFILLLVVFFLRRMILRARKVTSPTCAG